METNEMVNKFLIEKFKEDSKRIIGCDFKGYDKQKHLVDCESIVVKTAECEWSCGCYSCYTRDDVFDMTAHIGCDCGVEVRFCYGSMYNLPDFIQELDEYNENN